MKISKLFHYLYAFLMLMPVFAVGVKCGYVMFNKNALQSYTGSFEYQSYVSLSTDEINTYLPIVLTRVSSHNNNHLLSNDNTKWFGSYSFLLNNNSSIAPNNDFTAYCFTNLSNVTFDGNQYLDCHSLIIGHSTLSNLSSTIRVSLFSDIIPSDIGSYGGLPTGNVATFALNTDFVNLTFTKNDHYLYVIKNNLVETTTISTANILSYAKIPSYIVDDNLSSVFYASIQELDKVSFFSWARHSFIAEPFLYIGNLFGIPDVHPIFTFLSYWCAISIIYLVFDLFMYVPLLVHRWIDKAKVD